METETDTETVRGRDRERQRDRVRERNTPTWKLQKVLWPNLGSDIALLPQILLVTQTNPGAVKEETTQGCGLQRWDDWVSWRLATTMCLSLFPRTPPGRQMRAPMSSSGPSSSGCHQLGQITEPATPEKNGKTAS